jgi:hypothetical protein
MQNLKVVKRSQSFDHLSKNIPNLFLFEIGTPLLIVEYFLEEISSVGILHYDAECRGMYHSDFVGGS